MRNYIKEKHAARDFVWGACFWGIAIMAVVGLIQEVMS
jgi:hypothetical protein